MGLNLRLAAFYFMYYGTVGAFMAYWPPYLLARGFTATDVGMAYALMGVSRATVPVVWGWWADRSGRRMAMIRVAALLSLLIFGAIPLVTSVPAVTALMLAYTLFWNALLPQFEVVALNHLRASGTEYARVRLWGSVGFVGAVLGTGPALDAVGILWEPWLVSVLFAAMAGLAWTVPDSGPEAAAASAAPSADAPTSAAAPGAGLLGILTGAPVLLLLAACFFSQVSFAPYYGFYTVFLEAQGYTRGFAGQMWALAVVAEIVMFVYAGRVLSLFGSRRLLVLALVSTALRWTMIGLSGGWLPVLVAAQLLHATSFACYHLVAMHYLQRLFPPTLHGRAQAIYNSASYGIGGALGALGAGMLWDAAPPSTLFLAAAVFAAAGALLARRLPSV